VTLCQSYSALIVTTWCCNVVQLWAFA